MMLTLLDVLLGLTLLFAALSVFCSGLVEAAAARTSLRGKMLRGAIYRMLGEESLYRRVIHHPAVAATRRGGSGATGAPSYLAPERFVAALLDVVPVRARTMGLSGAHDAEADEIKDAQVREFFVAARYLSACGIAVGAPLAGLARRHGQSVDALKAALVGWYDSQMERVGGWYKRRIQRWLFLTGLLVAVLFNVDTLQVVSALAREPALRAWADQAATAASPAPTQAADVRQLLASGKTRGLPVGYACLQGPEFGIEMTVRDCYGAVRATSWLERLLTLLGWLLTAAAVSFGAPFWFDVLAKVSNLRSAGRPVPTSR